MNSGRKASKMELFYNAAGLLRQAAYSKTLQRAYAMVDNAEYADLYKALNRIENSIDADIQYCNNLLEKLRSGSNKGHANKQN